MDDLHVSFMPILRVALRSLRLPVAGRALDLASGAGHKLGLLRELLDPQLRICAVDCDSTELAQSLALHTSVAHVVADAHELPFGQASFEIAFCLAALGLFEDRQQVLCELRRVLKPGAALVISTTEMRWCERIAWPAQYAQRLAQAYEPFTRCWEEALPASPDIGDDFHSLLVSAGFTSSIRAFALDAPDPLSAELSLLPWAGLRPLVTPYIDITELQDFDAVAACVEPVLCPIVLLGCCQAL